MKIIDAHVHLDRVAGEDILRMAWSGARVGIVPTPHLMAGLFTSETVMQLWDKTLGYMAEYAASLGIECCVTLAVPLTMPQRVLKGGYPWRDLGSDAPWIRTSFNRSPTRRLS